MENAISLCDEDDEDDIQRYENLIFINKAAIESCAWDYDINDWGKSWYKEWMLSDEAINVRRELIRDYEAKIKTIKNAKEQKEKEAAQNRFDAYWVEHADEKANLEIEKATIEEQISALQVEINNIPGSAEKENIQGRINTLTAEKSSLGLFKGKEKKAVQEKIDATNLELKKVIDRMDVAKEEIEKKIDLLQRRINEINSELTKAR